MAPSLPVVARVPYTVKPPARCPHCGSTRLIRKGTRRKKLEIVQLWQCKLCRRVFTPAPPSLRYKTYPLRVILDGVTLYNLGYSLTEVFRQAAQSRIITSAHRINQGSIPDLSPPETESDFYFVQAEDPETAVGRIIELVKTRIPKRFGLDPIRDIQVLCPMNRGGVGARSLNIELQAALNPAGDRKVERFG
jgi:transposase-like protein